MIEPTPSDIGRHVVYKSGHGAIEFGRITSFTTHCVFVRYYLKRMADGREIARCGDTSEATRREDLDWSSPMLERFGPAPLPAREGG